MSERFDRRMAEQRSQNSGSNCFGCAAWLPAGKGVVLKRKTYVGDRTTHGVYCSKACRKNLIEAAA